MTEAVAQCSGHWFLTIARFADILFLNYYMIFGPLLLWVCLLMSRAMNMFFPILQFSVVICAEV